MKSYIKFTAVHFQCVKMQMCHLFFIVALFFSTTVLLAQNSSISGERMEVGVARIDITPEEPIRLAGYGHRKKEVSEGIIHRLEAKALAFGSDEDGPSILITADMIGIPGHLTAKLADQLSEKIGIDPAQLVIFASHTHGAPEVGNLLNILQNDNTLNNSVLALDQLIDIAEYTDQLSQKLEQVALAAVANRAPALVSWGIGQAGFAKNRRPQGGPTDSSLPLLKVADPEGNLRAVLVNYACHGTTLTGRANKIHGDWMSEAQRIIEANYPGATAMISIGCGADADPNPRGSMEDATLHGQEIADNVDKLLTSQLQPLTVPPVGKIKWVKLPFAHVPTVPELIKQAKEESLKGYYARVALDRVVRGYKIPGDISYPVQTWTFGDKLAMINLAGEVVVDYAKRLKNELGAERLWTNAYANDVPCYIASRRVIREGGYEADNSMYCYDKPSPFVEEVEDIIVTAVHDLLPATYKMERPLKNSPIVIQPEEDGILYLRAEIARAIGPKIAYMPEWKAFGWFTEEDKVEWDVNIPEKGRYDVYLEWSVSDKESGKPFVFETNGREISGKIEKTGSWLTYRTEKIGRVKVLAGRQKITFKPGSKSEKGALMDLREVRLVPVN